MGKDGQPKHRQKARDLKRQVAVRGLYERVLIVCEGEKTEPNYFNEIRAHYKLQTANVVVRACELGTAPIQVVKYAEQLFLEGDSHHKLEAREFDRIFAVFDRDDHASYNEALIYCEAASLRNKERQAVPLVAIPSVPCFELWLLLHYEDVLAPLHRDEVYARLRAYLPKYDKGVAGYWQQTMQLLPQALRRANWLKANHQAADGTQPWTSVELLVEHLIKLKTIPNST
jgi:RloB-like protein